MTQSEACPPVPPNSDLETRWLNRTSLDQLIQLLTADGWEVIGPTIDQSAIVYDRVNSVADLPEGWTDDQSPGRYRLQHRDDGQLFGYAVGPHSWKKYLFPANELVASARRAGGTWEFTTPELPERRLALLGVRACELAAIAVQDRVFLGGPYVDPLYQRRRESLLLIAVNCTQAAATCFCSSMNTGPRCRSGFDLALTELADGFTVEPGSERGQSLLDRLGPLAVASPRQTAAAEVARRQATEQMIRSIQTEGLPQMLRQSLECDHWEEVAKRCLSCSNCTMVCPTCFCSTVTEVSELTHIESPPGPLETHAGPREESTPTHAQDERIDRRRQWDSCFNIDFSRVNGVPARNTVAGRYRQWLTHKLSTWHDQFGTSGCVGCGRCITWCPPGIDLTEEVASLWKLQEQRSGRSQT
jgi:Fe-S-cluster-containing hydrogenase component 2